MSNLLDEMANELLKEQDKKVEVFKKNINKTEKIVDKTIKNLEKADIILQETPEIEVINISNFNEDSFEDELQKDFMIARQNTKKLINIGQRVMDSIQNTDLLDLNPKQIEAIAQMNVAVANSIDMLMKSYRTFVDIQKIRGKYIQQEKQITTEVNNPTQNITNNMIVTDTTSIIDIIKNSLSTKQ